MNLNINNGGEVAAISGYYKQYEIFATKIYDYLLNDEIEWVELASSEVGKLDDVLIGLENKIIAYQVKNISSSKFSYSSFIFSETESILEGSFKGWLKIKTQYPNHILEAKIVTTQSPSEDDRITAYKGASKPSFKKFCSNFWNKIKSGKYNLENIPLAWQPVFEELKTLTNADEIDLIQFIIDFEFIFEHDTIENQIIDNYTWRKRKEDIDKITKSIFEIIGRKGNVKLTKDNILTDFGLGYRYETHFRHSFFVDELHYQPIKETVGRLNELASIDNQGYIALIGNAGSGKSTLLTKWLNDCDHRVLKYYAYVNKDMNYNSGYRGEAKIFLKDLLVQIREKGASIQDRLPTNDIEDLQKHLKEELNKISKSGVKTFILIDGLDHIEREQKINKSLISILPLPEQIPENVYFILGTRTIERLDDLPQRIKLDLINKQRIITIKPFSKEQVDNLTKSYDITLDQNQLENLFTNSKGHPLFLRYTIEAFFSKGFDKVDEIINENIFSGDIYDEYRIFWNNIKTKVRFVELLGVLSRFRYSYIDVKLLSNFNFSREEAEEAKKMSEHYFFKKGNLWQFFHNSFKEFLIEETSKDIFSEEYDSDLNISFHLKIYEGIKDINDEYKWNIIYHLFEAKEYGLIVETISQEYFREQWFEYRNTRYINDDIKLVAQAGGLIKSLKTLLICSLSEYELRQRINNFTPSLHYESYHKLSMIDLANSFIYNSVELLVEKEVALDYSLLLYQKGYSELSLEIFRKAEPTFILNNVKEVSSRKITRDSVYQIDEVELMSTWAKASSVFNPLSEIFEKLKNFEVVKEFPADEGRDVLSESIYEILQLRIDAKDWEGLKELISIVNDIGTKDELFYCYFKIVWNLDDDDDFYNYCKNELSKWNVTKNNKINIRLALFEVLINKDLKRGKLVFEKLTAPINKDKGSSIDHYDLYNYVFNYSRLYYIIYQKFLTNTNSFVPDLKNLYLTAFCNEYAELGKSYAYIHLESKEASIEFVYRIKQIFHYFHNHITEKGHEYSIHENKADIINLILKLSLKVSDELFNEILSEVSIEWNKNEKYWKENKQQEVLEWVIKSKKNDEWCTRHLIRLNTSIFQDGYNTDRIDKGVFQVKLWALLGRINEGKEILNHLMEISLDVRGEKDHQIDYLVSWLGKFEEVDSNELKYYLDRLDSIYQKVNSGSRTPAKEIFIYSLDKGNGFEMFKYLLMEGLVELNDGVEILLEYFLQKFPKKRTLFVSLYIRLVLAFDNNHYNRESFFFKLLKLDLSTSELKKIIKDIKIYTILEHRDDYLLKLKDYSLVKGFDLEEIGLNIEIIKKDKDSSSYLTLKDGTSYSKDEVIEVIKDYDHLVELISKEENHGYFNWLIIIENLSPSLNLEQLKSLLKIKNYSSVDLIKYAQIFYDKGDSGKTKELIENALNQSKHNSWDEVYDNDIRMKAFSLYHKIDDKEYVQNEAIKDFSYNFNINHESLIGKYDSVFKLMSEELKIEDIYKEIYKYKNELLKSHYITEGTPEIDGGLTNEELLYRTIIFLIEIPSRFDDFIIEILLNDFHENKNLIKVLLTEIYKKEYYYTFTKLVAGISLIDVEFLTDFNSKIVNMLNHDRYDIHSISIRVLERMKVNSQNLYEVKSKKEPLTYSLKLDGSRSLILSEDVRFDRIGETGYLPDTDNPIEYVWIYKKELELITDQTDYELINLATRVKQHSKNMIIPEWYRNLSEEELRNLFNNRFGVRTTYLRPRSQSVINGMMIVLKELVELRKIETELADYISNIFDESIYLIQPQEKPKFISSILKKDNYAPSADRKWAHEITEELLDETLKFSVFGDLIILAETATIKGQGDGHVREDRQSFIDSFDNAIKSNLIFSTISKCYYENYEYGEFTNNITYYNWLMTFNQKRNWLAFNRGLAQHMELKLSPDGYFRWLDEKDNVVVESIYWQSGEEYNNSRNLHSESGNGWFVVITKKGFERLKKALGYKKLYQHKRIERELKFIQSNYDTYINEKNSDYKVNEIPT
ncbi:AAA-like domain-containing protein [Aureibaculum sp. A20]|uniref:AAA-like domain-containing protein n=1 Tax=Aureibaculum flavum TaxID=2795986 RepID=A0ABS0WP35_9FLAO|nr:ATP-binding protein [Aureibaculum flavum]MBJ2173628.1 AAA-like domain-containing protein [Aureibaculum flavum]